MNSTSYRSVVHTTCAMGTGECEAIVHTSHVPSTSIINLVRTLIFTSESQINSRRSQWSTSIHVDQAEIMQHASFAENAHGRIGHEGDIFRFSRHTKTSNTSFALGKKVYAFPGFSHVVIYRVRAKCKKPPRT